MDARDLLWVVLALSVAAVAFYLVRLLQRLERSANALDDLLVTAHHQLEMTAEQSRDTMREVKFTSATVTEQVKKVEKVVATVQVLVESLRANTALVQKVIATPLAGISGVVAGVSRGIETLAQRKSKGAKA
jgi:uncharacterized protein YoxC